MENRDAFSNFRQVLLDCYGLWSWRLDGDLNVIDTNCPQPNLHRQLLLSPRRTEILRSYLQDETMPMIMGNPLGLVWAVAVSPSEPKEIVVLGPVFTGEVPDKMAETLIAPYELSFKKKRELLECLRFVPRMSSILFFQYTVLLYRVFAGGVLHPSDFIYHLPDPEETAGEELFGRGEQSELPHSPHINERTLLDMVRTGNLEYHQALSAAGSASFGIRTKSSDPIQQAKYSVVAFITLCARAAIEGGLSADCAYTLSDTYTENVDNCKSISEITAVSHAMYDDYIRRVNRCRNESNLSRPIQASLDYIDTHPDEDISIEDLASKSGYTDYYFTRMFKKETGQTVKEYIRAARLRLAKTLLLDTNLSVHDISQRLHFSTQSYFAGLFQKAEGLTPSEFRMKNKK